MAWLSSAKGEEFTFPQGCQYPTLHHLHAGFGLRLIARFGGTRRHHSHSVMGSHLLIRAIDARLIAARFRHARLQVVRSHDLRHPAQKLEGAHVGADPVGQSLRQARLGIGVVTGTQDSHEDRRFPHLPALRIVDGGRGAGVIDEQPLAGAMLLPQHYFLPPQPGAVQVAETAVPISVRVLVPVLFPEQLQSDVLIGLQFVAETGIVRLWRVSPGQERRPRRSYRLHQAAVVPIGDLGPLQARRTGGFQILGNRRLADGTTQRDLALT
jgi:hypothetical protein